MNEAQYLQHMQLNLGLRLIVGVLILGLCMCGRAVVFYAIALIWCAIMVVTAIQAERPFIALLFVVGAALMLLTTVNEEKNIRNV